MSVRDEAKFLGGTMARAVVVILSLSVLATVILLATGTIKKWTADFRGSNQAREQTVANGAFRIATYQSFFDLCSAVQSDEDAIRNLEDEAKTAPADRKARIQQILTATKNTRAENVRDYNSKAGQEHKTAFLDAGLPARLDVNNMDTACK